MQTTATGAVVVSKTKKNKKAVSCKIDMDLKNNKGVLREKKQIDWKKEHGTSVEFQLDGRIQLKGEAGILTYLRGTVLLNPHLTLIYKIGDDAKVVIKRVTNDTPKVPGATDPHPHTMKLGEFISHARLFDGISTKVWLKRGFSRISENVNYLMRCWLKKLPT
jgi:DNA topoisomerase-6 subunit B